MDGVIIDSHAISQRLLPESGERNGINFDREDLKLWQGSSGKGFREYAKLKYHLPNPVEFYLSDYDGSEEIRRYAKLSPVKGITGLLEDLRQRSFFPSFPIPALPFGNAIAPETPFPSFR
jgi:beta-phosphoglucomutase-like phosphatase (HAD superfamily)